MTIEELYKMDISCKCYLNYFQSRCQCQKARALVIRIFLSNFDMRTSKTEQKLCNIFTRGQCYKKFTDVNYKFT